MARPAKSIKFHLVDGKKHLGKQEIKERQAMEVTLGEEKYEVPPDVKKDKVAYKKWKELIDVFKTASVHGLVTSSDITVLADFCKVHSEYMTLTEERDSLRVTNYLEPSEDEKIKDLIEENYDKRFKYGFFRKLDFITSLDGILKLESAINKKLDLLIKLSDRLFLNPLAKVRNIPRKKIESKENDPLSAAGFGNV